MTLNYAGVPVEHREVLLKDKPQAMLEASPKGTVPILQLTDGSVIDESIEVMKWALVQRDTDHWWQTGLASQTLTIVEENDFQFKKHLDQYKYADRHPQYSQSHYRTGAGSFLAQLESRLSTHTYLLDERLTFADVAIFPFIRQFAFVDKHWFDQAPYPGLQAWLHRFLDSRLFSKSMKKHLLWHDS